MRPLAFTTIAFLAGQHGFGIFVPYLGVFLVTAQVIRWRRRRHTATQPVESIALAPVATA